MYKLPIYLNKSRISNLLEPEQVYSTYPGENNVIACYILSEHELKLEYQGIWGAVHYSSNADSGFYSVHSLIRCGAENLHGLSLELV